MSVDDVKKHKSDYSRRGNTLSNAADMLALLMWEPHTKESLIDNTGLSYATIHTYLKIFRAHGIVYVCGKSPTTGRSKIVYRANEKPFKNLDYKAKE